MDSWLSSGRLRANTIAGWRGVWSCHEDHGDTRAFEVWGKGLLLEGTAEQFNQFPRDILMRQDYDFPASACIVRIMG